MSQHYWRNGAPTDAAIEAFTCGDCWILAMNLSELSGFPIYLVDAGIHWLVHTPRGGQFLDVTGLSTRSAVLNRWDAISLCQADPDILNYASRDMDDRVVQDYEDSYRRAPLLAKRLLEKYGFA